MADSSVPITSGTGTNVDTFTQANGDHRQAVVLGDAAGSATAKVNTNGDLTVALSNPSALAAGIFAGLSGYGAQRVTVEPYVLFQEAFDSALGLDPVKWSTPGTAAPTFGNGAARVEPGTAASTSTALVSVPTFAPPGATFLGLGMLNRFENLGSGTGTVGYLNAHRFFGVGTVATWNATYNGSTTGPLLHGYGFEIDVDGNLYAVVYASGVRTRADAVGQATGEKRLNLGRSIFNGEAHQFTLVMRPDAIFWYIDGQDLPAATLNYRTPGFPIPDVQTLPVRLHTINSATAPSGTMTHRPATLAFADTGHNSTTISDGVYGWRDAAVGADNSLQVNIAASASSIAPVTGTFTNVAGSAVTVDVTTAGNATIALVGGSFTNLPIIFEASSDLGTSWFPINAAQLDGTGTNVQYVVPNATAGARAWNIGCPGYSHIRVRLTAAAGVFTTSPTLRVTLGAFLWQPAPVSAPVDGQKPTYSALVSTSANLATDFYQLIGSASRTVRLVRLEVGLSVSGTITAGSNVLNLIKRSSATTSGTFATIAQYDSADPAPTAAVSFSTVAPGTVGTSAGTVRAASLAMVAGTYATWVWDFGNRPSRAPTLRGFAQTLNLSLNAVFAGTSPVLAWSILAEWTEE